MTKFTVKFKIGNLDEQDQIVGETLAQTDVEIAIPQIDDTIKDHKEALAKLSDEKVSRIKEALNEKLNLPRERKLLGVEDFYESKV